MPLKYDLRTDENGFRHISYVTEDIRVKDRNVHRVTYENGAKSAEIDLAAFS